MTLHNLFRGVLTMADVGSLMGDCVKKLNRRQVYVARRMGTQKGRKLSEAGTFQRGHASTWATVTTRSQGFV